MRSKGISAALLLALLIGGCGGGAATFEVVPISKDEAGNVVATESSRAKGEGKHAGLKVNIGMEYVTITAQGASDNVAKFTITWPDRTKHEASVGNGQSGDFFYGGGGLGVRITVRAIR